MITGEVLEDVEFADLRGLDGIRHATIMIGERPVRIGIAHGLGNARALLEGIRDGKFEFEAIEIMACPGGCIGGGDIPPRRYRHSPKASGSHLP